MYVTAHEFDFIALKRQTQAITDTLDHRMLLPTESALIRVEEREGSIHVRYGERRWMFPREDCVLLPLANGAKDTSSHCPYAR